MEPTELLAEKDNLIVFLMQTGDTMHLHQTLRQSDKAEYLKSMVREVQSHEWRKHWKLEPVT